MSDDLAMTALESARLHGFPLALRDQPPTPAARPSFNLFEPSAAAGPIFPKTNNLAAVRGTPNTRVEPTPFENLLNMLTGSGPQPTTYTNLIGSRG